MSYFERKKRNQKKRKEKPENKRFLLLVLYERIESFFDGCYYSPISGYNHRYLFSLERRLMKVRKWGGVSLKTSFELTSKSKNGVVRKIINTKQLFVFWFQEFRFTDFVGNVINNKRSIIRNDNDQVSTRNNRYFLNIRSRRMNVFGIRDFHIIDGLRRNNLKLLLLMREVTLWFFFSKEEEWEKKTKEKDWSDQSINQSININKK